MRHCGLYAVELRHAYSPQINGLLQYSKTTITTYKLIPWTLPPDQWISKNYNQRLTIICHFNAHALRGLYFPIIGDGITTYRIIISDFEKKRGNNYILIQRK